MTTVGKVFPVPAPEPVGEVDTIPESAPEPEESDDKKPEKAHKEKKA